jgi:hypothetical protein
MKGKKVSIPTINVQQSTEDPELTELERQEPAQIKAELQTYNNLYQYFGKPSGQFGGLPSMLEVAVKELTAHPQNEWKEIILNSQIINDFFFEIMDYSHKAATALNSYNDLCASKAGDENKETKIFLRIDAKSKIGEKRTASALIPLKDLEDHIRITGQNFVNFDDEAVLNEGLQSYLTEKMDGKLSHPLSLENLVYSHFNEILQDNKVIYGNGNEKARFEPVSIVRLVTDKLTPTEKYAIEMKIIDQIGQKLFAEGILFGQWNQKRARQLKKDLESIFYVNPKGFSSLYSLFEHTRFFMPVLSDAVKQAKPKNLRQLTFFEEIKGKKPKKYVQESEERKQRTIKIMENIIAANINAPYLGLEWGIKKMNSFADKILLYQYSEEIKKGFGTTKNGYGDGPLNKYLKRKHLPRLTEAEIKQRDIRDWHRMKFLVHSNSISYYSEVGMRIPKAELDACEKVYDLFFWIADIPANARSGEKWTNLIPRKTSDGFYIDVVKDYIAHAKENGFRVLKIYAMYRPQWETQYMIAEIQGTTNFFDNFNRLSKDASHEDFKRRNQAIIDYCIGNSPNKEKAELNATAIRYLLSHARSTVYSPSLGHKV